MKNVKDRLAYERHLQEAIDGAGITKKGEPLARVIWEAAEKVYAAAERAEPWEVNDMVSRLFRSYAADVQVGKVVRKPV